MNNCTVQQACNKGGERRDQGKTGRGETQQANTTHLPWADHTEFYPAYTALHPIYFLTTCIYLPRTEHTARLPGLPISLAHTEHTARHPHKPLSH